MTPKRQQPETPPDLTPERAHTLLQGQLQKLQGLKGRNYHEADATENEWYQLIERLVMRSFGSNNTNLSTFRRGHSAGIYVMQMYDYVDHGQNQSDFQARLQAYESALRACISELELDLPDPGIKGVYESGQEYEFYRDVTACLKLARREIFVIDPYLNTDIFNEYAGAIPRTVQFRLLSANVPSDVMALAQKYASGGNFALHTSNSIHDRVLFADNRVWVTGQSLKDAAKRKPTYIVEHDEPLMRDVYESIWNSATTAI